jgi:hypothetical protein
MDEIHDEQAWTFLVERYWPGIDDEGLRAALPRLEHVARAMQAEGRPVEHLGSLLMSADQVVFSVVRAGSEAAVREANERAGLPLDRIAEVVAFGFRNPLSPEAAVAPPGGETR